MAKLTLTNITSGHLGTSTFNTNNDLIEAALENTLSRDGTSPNTMSASLDMNSNRIVNLPNASNNTEPVTLAQAASIQSFTGVVATPGSVGAVLWPVTSAETAAGVTPTSYEYEPGDVRRYGAIGDGTTNDYAALAECASVCTGLTGHDMHIPTGYIFQFETALDLTGIRVINGRGKLRTKLSGSVDYVTIGSTSNMALAMEGADIYLYVQNNTNSGNDNTGLTGTTGIKVRGLARANLRLIVYNADTGVEFAPATGEYIAFNKCHFYVQGCRVAHHWNASGTGWYNQNTFDHCDLYSAGNVLAGDETAILMDSATGPNNNVYYHVNVESQDKSMVIHSGSRNYFYNIRNESSGEIEIGDGTTQETTGLTGPWGNHFEFGYHSPDIVFQAERPNTWSSGSAGQINWKNLIDWDYLDMIKVGAQGGYSSMTAENSVAATPYFTSGVREDANMSFDPGSNNRIRWWIPVKQGDILRIVHDVDEGDSDTSPRWSAYAQDANKSNLAAPGTGTLRYLGTNGTTNISGTSDTDHTITATSSAWANPLLMSVNRSEVKFVAIELINTIDHIGFKVDKLVWGKTATAGLSDGHRRVKGSTDLAAENLAAGQIALGDPGRIAIGGGSGGTMQLTQLPTATAANIALSTSDINTKHKVQGLMVYDTTNNRVMVADGSDATSVWTIVDGTGPVTPSP